MSAPERTAKSRQRSVSSFVQGGAIASGGMATAYLGVQIGPLGYRRPVVVKKLHAQYARDPDFVAMLLDEARLCSRVRHPAIVPVVDVLSAGGELTLVLEYVPGAPLSFLRNAGSGPIAPELVVAVGTELCEALRAIHDATDDQGRALSIVHRDISPQNVMIAIDGSVRVLDFGVAKARFRAQATRTGELKGKPGYMAPEQLALQTVDARTDVYAVGVLLWELLSGQRLHENAFSAEQLTAVLADGPPALDELPPDAHAVGEVLRRAMQTRAADRFPGAAALGAALEQAATPAPRSALRSWVENLASPLVADYARALDQLEADAGSNTPGQIAPSTNTAITQRISDAETTSVSQSGLATSARSGSIKPARALLLLAAGVAIGLIFWTARGMRSAPTPVAQPGPRDTPVAAVQPVHTQSLSAVPTVRARSDAASAPAATNARARERSGVRPPTPTERSVLTSATPRDAAPGVASASSPTPKCSPPYRIESDGVRVFKEECL